MSVEGGKTQLSGIHILYLSPNFLRHFEFFVTITLGPKITNHRQKSGDRLIRTKFGLHTEGINRRRLCNFPFWEIPLTPKK